MAFVTTEICRSEFLENELDRRRTARKTTFSWKNPFEPINENSSSISDEKPTYVSLLKSNSILRSIEFPLKFLNQIRSANEEAQTVNIFGLSRNEMSPSPLNSRPISPSRLRFGTVPNDKTSLTSSHSPFTSNGAFGFQNSKRTIARQEEPNNSPNCIVKQERTIITPESNNSGVLAGRKRGRPRKQEKTIITPESNNSGERRGRGRPRKRKSDPLENLSEKIRVIAISSKNEKTKLNRSKIEEDKDNTSINFFNKVGCDISGAAKRVVNEISNNVPFNPKMKILQLSTSTVGQSKVEKAGSGSSKESENEMDIQQPSPSSKSTLLQHLPNIDVIDGFEFLSFEKEEDLLQFAKRKPNRTKTNDVVQMRESPIVLSKTSDLTKIKGWRKKCFESESKTGKPKTPQFVDLDLAVFEEKLPGDFTSICEDSQDDDGCTQNDEINPNLKIETLSTESSPNSAFISEYLEDFLRNKSTLRSSLDAKLKIEEPPSKSINTQFIWPTEAALPKIKPAPFRMNTGKKISLLLPHSLNTHSKVYPKQSGPLNSQSNNNEQNIFSYKMLKGNDWIPVDEMEEFQTTSTLVSAGKSSKYPEENTKSISPKYVPEAQVTTESKNSDENHESLNANGFVVNISRHAAELSLTALKSLNPSQMKSTARKPQENTDEEPVRECVEPCCRLGCLCESLKMPKRERDHCGKPSCMLKCLCKTGKKVEKVLSVLPKRQTRLPARLQDSFVWKNDSDLVFDIDCDQPVHQIDEVKNEHHNALRKERANCDAPVSRPNEDTPEVKTYTRVKQLEDVPKRFNSEGVQKQPCKINHYLLKLDRKIYAESNQMLTRETRFMSKTSEQGPIDRKDETRQGLKSLKLSNVKSSSTLPTPAKIQEMRENLKRLNLTARSVKLLHQNEMKMLNAKRMLMNQRNNLWNRALSQTTGVSVEKRKPLVKDLVNRLQFSGKGSVNNEMSKIRQNCTSQGYVKTRDEDSLPEHSDKHRVVIKSEPTDEREPNKTLVKIPSSRVPTSFSIANFQRYRVASINNADQKIAPHTAANLFPSEGQWKNLTPARLINPLETTNFKRSKEIVDTDSNAYSNNSLNMNSFTGFKKTVYTGSKTDFKNWPNNSEKTSTGCVIQPTFYRFYH